MSSQASPTPSKYTVRVSRASGPYKNRALAAGSSRVSVQWLEYEKWPREYATVQDAASTLSTTESDPWNDLVTEGEIVD